MARTPNPEEYPKLRIALRVYQILAWITGLFLLLLVVEMVMKYAYGLEFALGVSGELVSIVPSSLFEQGDTGLTNLSLIIQITHGYIYMAYLVSSFVLVNWLRWPILRFVLIALGGVVPLLSFFVEHRVSRDVHRVIGGAQ